MTRLREAGGSLFSSDAVGNIGNCGEERARTSAALGSSRRTPQHPKWVSLPFSLSGHSDLGHLQVCVMCWGNSDRSAESEKVNRKMQTRAGRAIRRGSSICCGSEDWGSIGLESQGPRGGAAVRRSDKREVYRVGGGSQRGSIYIPLD